MKRNLFTLLLLLCAITAKPDTRTTVRLGDTAYVASASFYNKPDLEEVIFDGMIGHIDGYQFRDCPKLKRIVFNGPVLSTGGLELASNCPELETVEINGLAVSFSLTQNPGCPKVAYKVKYGACFSADESLVDTLPASRIDSDATLRAQMERLVAWDIANMSNDDFLSKIAQGCAVSLAPYLERTSLAPLSAELTATYRCYHNPEDDLTMLELLKASAPYVPDDSRFTFSYAQPTDSLLSLSRLYFNLDSIAGSGPDSERIKRLLYWCHDLVTHDGTSSRPDCPYNLRDLYEVSVRDKRGLNCRFMAIMLTEALLAEGIPARYLTCESKRYQKDPDCHVICIAWASDLDKWVWVDPTFAAYVTDENGLMLHPGEVRYRLQHDLPLVLNDDANWNHRMPQTKADYLDEYMAKNLYLISANLINGAEPEGTRVSTAHPQGRHITLVPQGFEYYTSAVNDIKTADAAEKPAPRTTTDEAKFWQKPFSK